MDEKDFTALMDKFQTEAQPFVQGLIEKTVSGLITTDKFEEQVSTLATKEAVQELTEAVEKQGLDLQKIIKGEDSKKSLEELVQDKAIEIKKIATGDAKNFKLEIKADVLRANVTGSTQAFRLPDIGIAPTQRNVWSQVFRHVTVGPDSNGVIRYVDQQPTGIVRSADVVAEGASKPESEMEWEEYTMNITKIADTIPVSMEAFRDVSFIAGELRRLLEINVAIKEDQQILNGSGVGANMTGVYTAAPTFAAVASGIQAASIYDLIVKVHESIVNGTGGKYMPNFVGMNIVDVNAMRLTKDQNDNYVLPPFVTANGEEVAGMRVLVSNQVTANTLIVGDSDYATIYDLEGLTIDMGWINDQFIKNMTTMRAEKRAAVLVREVDKTGFLKCTDIAADLVTLAT